jgi:HEAT repeat protein
MAARAVGIVTLDRALVVRSWDEWLVRATGLAEQTMLGQSLLATFPDIEERGLADRIRHVIDTGVVEVLAPAFHHYLIACPPAQTSAHFTHMQQHVTIAPLRGADGITGVVITIEDVTERFERERTLALQLKSDNVAIRLRAASSLAHDERLAADPLLGALGDADWTVRRAAVEGLARRPNPRTAGALIAALRDQHRDIAVLNAALSAIAESPEELVPQVVALLQEPDPDLRGYAALGLGLMADPRAVQPLVEAVRDPDPNVRFQAIEALGRLRAHAACDTLAAIAESDDIFLGYAAIDALAAIGDSSVAPRLLPLLNSPGIREAVINALAVLQYEGAAAPLAELLSNDDVPVSALASALARLQRDFQQAFGEGALIVELARAAITTEGAQRLVHALAGANDQEMPDLAVVLGWLELEGVPDALAALLGHATASPAAVEALVRRGESAVDVLVNELRNRDPITCKPAALALGRIGNARAVTALAELLNEPAEVSAVAASALGSIGDARAFEPLLALLGHQNPRVRQAVVSALNSISHPETSARIKVLLDDPSPLVREAAVRVAGYFGFGECLEPILRRCADSDERVRRIAVEHLPFFDDPRAHAALAAALRAPSSHVRAAAARAAALAAPDSAIVETLRAALRDDDFWVRYHAVRSLARLGADDVVADLCELAANDAATPVRIAAVDALGELKAPEAAPLLAQLAFHGDTELALPAISALGSVADADGEHALMKFAAGSEPRRSAAALQALSARADAGAIAELSGLALAQAGSATMDQAISALEHIPDERAYAALLELTRHPACRSAAVTALTRVGIVAQSALERGLLDPAEEVRYAAVEVLARMKQTQATRLLSTALGDESPAVRRAAAQALARLDLQNAGQPGGDAPRSWSRAARASIVRGLLA